MPDAAFHPAAPVAKTWKYYKYSNTVLTSAFLLMMMHSFDSFMLKGEKTRTNTLGGHGVITAQPLSSGSPGSPKVAVGAHAAERLSLPGSLWVIRVTQGNAALV